MIDNNLLNQVIATKSWKQSAEYCSKRLGISVDKYKEYLEHYKSLKNKTKGSEVKADLDKGTLEIKKVVSYEPKDPEEIIKLLKIDTDNWKLSNYWNKEQPDGTWILSALVTKLDKSTPQHFLETTLKNFKPSYTPVTELHINKNFTKRSCALLSIQDLHFGKEGNEDVSDEFKNAIIDLVYRAYHSHNLERIVYVIGGDLLNMDTFNGTTTKGTPVSSHCTAQKAYDKAFDSLYWSINYLKQFCKILEVVYVPGNHDRLSSYHIAHALSKCFFGERNIIFHTEYSERKVIVYGCSMFAFEHGDVNSKDTPLVYAVEFPIEWGSSIFRTLYTGHFHKNKKVEYMTENERNGFIIRTLPSLSKADYWHYHNKYTGSIKSAILEVHDFFNGKVSEFVYNTNS